MCLCVYKPIAQVITEQSFQEKKYLFRIKSCVWRWLMIIFWTYQNSLHRDNHIQLKLLLNEIVFSTQIKPLSPCNTLPPPFFPSGSYLFGHLGFTSLPFNRAPSGGIPMLTVRSSINPQILNRRWNLTIQNFLPCVYVPYHYNSSIFVSNLYIHIQFKRIILFPKVNSKT